MIHRNFKYSLPSWLFILIGAILLYLIFGTGLHGDDYSEIGRRSISDFLSLNPETLGLAIFGVPNYFTFWWTYTVLGHDYQWGYDLIKWLAHLASVYMAWRFFTIFTTSERAVAAALLFTIFPLHETTTYWYMTAPYVFCPAVIMFSFYLLSANKIKMGFIVGLLGAFSGYLSPPYVFGLGVIRFFRNGRWGAGLEAEWVKKRELEDQFRFLNSNYNTTFFNIYHDLSPRLGLEAGLKLGRFLAGDWGGKLTVSRTYKHFTMGFWYTITDTSDFVSASNRGYHDKGVFLSIPYSIFTDKDSPAKLGYALSPWTRDVGQTVYQLNSLYPMGKRGSESEFKRNIEEMKQ